MNFSARIKELRKAKSVTQSDLGNAIGVTLKQIQRYERGECEPTLSKVNALADFFNVPVDYLLGRGVFKNWDKVLIYREAICRELLNVLPFLEETGLDLMALPEPYFMEILAATAEKIDYKEENGRPCFDITLYPFY